MLASIAALYDNLSRRPPCDCAALDEVPAEVDERGREGLARYIAELDLDVICTSYLWDGAPGAWDGVDAHDLEASDGIVVAFPDAHPWPGRFARRLLLGAVMSSICALCDGRCDGADFKALLTPELAWLWAAVAKAGDRRGDPHLVEGAPITVELLRPIRRVGPAVSGLYLPARFGLVKVSGCRWTS